MSDYILYVQKGNECIFPVVTGNVTWEVDRFGTPGKLAFSVLNTDDLNISEGNAVVFKRGDIGIFYGFIFKIKPGANTVAITAYDQLRYLKNKDSMKVKNLTAGGLVKLIAGQFHLKWGAIEDTGYVMPPRVEDGQTLADMINHALDATLTNTGRLYVLYDDFGKLALKNIESMRTDLLLDNSSVGDFDHEISIDGTTYNKIKLYRNDEKAGVREIYIAQSGENINKWGVLQYYEELKEKENGKAKADALLKLFNRPNRTFTVKNVLGDLRVRGGTTLAVQLKLGAYAVNSYMVVETARHHFEGGEHLMDLKLKGGAQ